MISFKRFPSFALGLALALAPTLSARGQGEISLPDLMHERLASVVAVQFSIDHEMERSVNYAYGLVIDRDGTVILEEGAISERATPEQLVDFRTPASNDL